MRKRTLILTAVAAFIVSLLITAKSYASILMGVAFATLGAIIAMTMIAGGAATLFPQGIFPRGGTYGSGQSPGQTVVSPSSIGRAGTVQWVDVRDIDPSTRLPRVKQEDVTLKADLQSLMDAAKSNPSRYPKLNLSSQESMNLTPPDIDLLPPFKQDRLEGYTVLVGSVYHKLGPLIRSGDYSRSSLPYESGATSGTDSGNPVINVTNDNGYSSGAYRSYQSLYVDLGVTPPNPPRPSTLPEFASKLAGGASVNAPANVYSDFYGEIDDYLKGNSGSFSVIDSVNPQDVDTASPYVMPTPATQAQVGALSSLAAGQNDVAAANNAVATAQANYNANPSPENAQALANAQAAAAYAAARYAELERQLEELLDDGDGATTPSLPGDSEYNSDFDLPELKGIAGLLTQFVSNSPLAGMVRSFSISTGGGESSFSAGQVYGRELNFSFSRWEPYLRMCGGALIIIAHGFAVMVVIRGW